MSFDVAAEAYDAFMGRWSQGLSPQLADFAEVQPGQRVLDVGAGTGVLTAELVARVGPGLVAAAEPSAPFAAAMRDRFPSLDVREAPAEALPFPDATFDAALAQLVVHFMADPLAGLREMSRVTRPGGVVAANVWDFGTGRGPLGHFWEAARTVDPSLADESERPGTREGHLVELMEQVGLGDVDSTARRSDSRSGASASGGRRSSTASARRVRSSPGLTRSSGHASARSAGGAYPMDRSRCLRSRGPRVDASAASRGSPAARPSARQLRSRSRRPPAGPR